jgi:tRNA A-37 threonylcarbamoyl transferase component Bud32
MGTNPEGRRDPGRKGDDPSSRPLSAVPLDPFAPAGSAAPSLTKVAPPMPTKTGTQPAMLVPPSVTSPGASDSLGARGWQSISGMEPEPEQAAEVDYETEEAEEAEEAEDYDDSHPTGTPTSFDGSRQLPDPDEVLIHMTQHGETPVPSGRDSGPDSGTVSQNNSSEDGESSSSGSGSLHPRRDALFGQVLADRYRVLDLIGKGGMGKVYLAEHVALGKRVAVKVLNPAYTHRPDQVKRFLREAQAASTIGHENVIDVIDFGEMPNGSVFFAMEHLQGEDLGKLLKRGPLQWSRARRILLQICRALQAAHARGIIHRDMKPENCFIIHRNGMRDFVKVLDFGIAKFLEENRQVSHTLTQAGALIGTPEYMAPEQVQGEPADVRMDIYALGCIMYQLLTGQLPFSDKTMFGVLSQQVNVRPVPPRQLTPEADIPPEVEAIILKAMEKERPNRFQSMAELIEAIVAAPRGSADRMGTTNNLDAAASAARIAAAMNAASGNMMAAGSPATPQDLSFPNGSGSAGAVPVTHGSELRWPGVVRDPKLLTKLVIGLGAAVFMLLIGLVCALNRSGDPEPSFLAPWLARAGAATAIPVAPPPTEPGPDKVPVEVPVMPGTPDPVAKTGDSGDIILEDDAAKKVVKDPVKRRDPVKKDPKKDPTPLAEPGLERLEPFDIKKTLNAFSKDIEGCRAANNATRGSIAVIKMKVEGNTGKVLDAVPEDPTPAAKCIAKVVKTKVKFPRFKLKVQEFKQRFQM